MRLHTATAYLDWLVGTLDDAAFDERDVLYRQRLASSTPVSVTVIRHQCPHCRSTWAKKQAATNHIARCWDNPDVRSCKTCDHHEPAEDGPYPEHPGWPAGCGIGQYLHDGRPVINCPLWTPAA
jgi:hypothetical protein